MTDGRGLAVGEQHHEVREGPSGSIFVTLRWDPKGIFHAGYADPGMPSLARDDSMMGAIGMGKTTLPNSMAVGYRRLPSVKVYVPKLHHDDELLPKLGQLCSLLASARIAAMSWQAAV